MPTLFQMQCRPVCTRPAQGTVLRMNQERLLFVIANPTRYEAVKVVLADVFDLKAVDNRWEADAILEQDPKVLVVEEVLPGGSGLKICERARSRPGGKGRLIILIGDRDRAAVDEEIKSGLIDGWIPRAASAGEFLHRFWNLYSRRDDLRMLTAEPSAGPVLSSSRQLFDEIGSGVIGHRTRALLSETATNVVNFADACSASSLLSLLQGHHAYTFAHSLRVGILMAMFGRQLGLADDHVKLMAETGLAHDVGKLRIPLEILSKPSRLTDDEMAVMRTHPALGADMLAEVYRDQPGLLSAVRHHHEHLSGGGYPDGLKGGQIDELSLLTAVVDVYSALTDRRDYKPPLPMQEATAIMDTMAGPHLEPRLYRRFREVISDLAASGDASTVAA